MSLHCKHITHRVSPLHHCCIMMYVRTMLGYTRGRIPLCCRLTKTHTHIHTERKRKKNTQNHLGSALCAPAAKATPAYWEQSSNCRVHFYGNALASLERALLRDYIHMVEKQRGSQGSPRWELWYLTHTERGGRWRNRASILAPSNTQGGGGTDRQTDRQTDWLTDWLIDWFADWLNGWAHSHAHTQTCQIAYGVWYRRGHGDAVETGCKWVRAERWERGGWYVNLWNQR